MFGKKKKKKRFENFNISENNIIDIQANIIRAELEKILECFVFQEGKKKHNLNWFANLKNANTNLLKIWKAKQ